MSNLLFSQRGRAVLSVGLLSGETKVYVDNIAAFADATALFGGTKYLLLTLESYDRSKYEIVKATAVGSDGGGDYFTVTRAQESTLAQDFTENETVVQARMTRGLLQTLRDDAAAAADFAAHIIAANPHGISLGTIGAAAAAHTHPSYLSDAPSDGNFYTRKDANWTAVSIISEFFNVVRDYGCPTDGTSDCSTAVAAAEAAAVAVGGGTVYFPPGTYNFTNPVTLTGGKVTYRGSSHRGTLLKNSMGSGTQYIFYNPTGYDDLTFIDLDYNLMISGGGFYKGDGNNDVHIRFYRCGGTQSVSIGRFVTNCKEARIFDCSIRNNIIDLVDLLQVSDSKIWSESYISVPTASEVYIDNTLFGGGGGGIPVYQLNVSEVGSIALISNCRFINAGTGVYCNGRATLLNNYFNGQDNWGVRVFDTFGTYGSHVGYATLVGNRAGGTSAMVLLSRAVGGGDSVIAIGNSCHDNVDFTDQEFDGDVFSGNADWNTSAKKPDEAWGVETLATADHAITHGLSEEPTKVVIQPIGNPQLGTFWVSSTATTTFNVKTTNISHPVNVYWHARVR